VESCALNNPCGWLIARSAILLLTFGMQISYRALGLNSAVSAMTYASDGVSRSPIHLLHRASQCAEEIFHAAITDGLTPRQFAVLIPTPHDYFIGSGSALGAGHQWKCVLARIMSCC
jgi:hypothetical protein